MEKYLERELSIMRTYYQYMMEHSGGVVKGVLYKDRFKEEYYKGKLEATEFIANNIVLCSTTQIEYYVEFLKNKGIIRGCFNCVKNPLINPEILDLPGCGEDKCYYPEHKDWEFKQPED